LARDGGENKSVMLKTRPAKRTYKTNVLTSKKKHKPLGEFWSDFVESNLNQYEKEGDQIWFATLTTEYTLTTSQARRLFSRWMNAIVRGGNSFWAFYVMEDFQCRNGCHIHAMVSTTATKLVMKRDWREVVGKVQLMGTDGIKTNSLARTQFDKPKRGGGGGATGYCCKYIMKETGDYDVTERHRTKMQNIRWNQN
jgi:hypothetical protein